MIEILEYAAFTALLSAFALLLLGKWRVLEWMQMHGNRLLSAMAGCTFCLSWWCGVLVAVTLYVITGDAAALASPLLSTPLTRIML